MKAAVIVFPGSNCDRDCKVAIERSTGAHVDMVWHGDTALPDAIDLIVLPGGYGNTFPAPVLAACTEPLSADAPDLRGIWKVLRAERSGKPAPEGDTIYQYVERIEQCGNRIVDMGGGTIADARADGTAANGVHDVFVLRPVGIPGVEVTRRLDADGHMIWIRPDRGGMKATLERIGKATDTYTRP